MCVICYKPAGAKMPGAAVINAMAEANPHGFGFCTSTGKFFKTTNFTTFVKRLASVQDDEACIMHFRLATHGSIKQANCHPFRDGDLFFAHNGVLPYPSINDRTDSEFAFKNILAPAVRQHGLLSPRFWRFARDIAAGSRFIFMRGENVVQIGDWTKVGDCEYSNTRWLCYINKSRFVYSACL